MKKIATVRKVILGFLSIGLLFLSACGSNTTQGGTKSNNHGIQERIIKAGIGLNEDHPEGQGLLKFKEIVEKKVGEN